MLEVLLQREAVDSGAMALVGIVSVVAADMDLPAAEDMAAIVPRGATLPRSSPSRGEASSFHRYVKLGIYPLDWAGDVSEDGSSFGERR